MKRKKVTGKWKRKDTQSQRRNKKQIKWMLIQYKDMIKIFHHLTIKIKLKRIKINNKSKMILMMNSIEIHRITRKI